MHRAFADEPFTVEMYGQDRVTRWARSWDLYRPLRQEAFTVALVAVADEVIVGVLVGSQPDHCHVCDDVALTPRPDDPFEAIDWQGKNAL